ncbi:Alpha/Beta hydrolase protein [Chytriomyces cf. hyalinus JEL632]|nr:Alpha/Beta hydrolase protein [Chytriomyces cf. hyalinus JEL632]
MLSPLTIASIAAAAAACTAAIYSAVVPSETVTLEPLSSSKIRAKKRATVASLYPPPEPGALARLSAGTTCFSITGSESGKRIILVHGISGTWASMPHIVSSLSQHGFRVLAYDLYGRGHSSSPGIRYTASDYTLQMKDLMDHVGWDRANVLGYSLGGGIATSFADVCPERVEKLVLIAPAGLSKVLILICSWIVCCGG